MRSIVFALAALATVVRVPVVLAAAEPAPKIAVIDVQRVISESKRGKEAKELLNKDKDYRERRLQEGQDNLQKKASDLERRRAILSPEAFEKEQEALLQERERLLRQFNEDQGQLRRRESELMQDVLEGIQGVLKTIAEKEGFTLVIEKGAAIYALDKYDITEQVLRLYDAKTEPKKK